ncbi:ribosomal protein L13 [Peptoanaerobacter stomatis]|jgi:ribosomal protein L13|uniref:Large ribosomal subunit protein uL13 n=1 Tax=Peptoanaerobacter stomatis TaxID=796937 RepID=G9XFS8_9FIRM|nr:50S ribosomal protein L13 [Peptoanaerobacter stomatis]EHL14825.1 ribosomal protein L13 [Peptoanaerobacter stomatis]EHL15821.1 50S ribosomal protein L13 [Peptoanaerobacter stomatis]EJU22899.1 ribosomal protein L13 [Peptoanaerobacter stomatis]NWO25516.1 50S ribosomal protein L13 [Peptostreptococcaceae bacterium oral taxon 081]
MKCYVQKPSEVQRKWHLIDAEGKTLGRLSTEIAKLLRGKHKVTFTPHVDGGDYVVVINAEKIEVTGKKRDNKVYRHHTGYIGNLKEINFKKLQEKKPEEIIRLSVSGMLPKNKLRAPMMKRLRIFAGPEHVHQAQNVENYEF